MARQLGFVIGLTALLLIVSSAFAEDGDGPRTPQYDQYLERLGVNSILRHVTGYHETLARYDQMKAKAAHQALWVKWHVEYQESRLAALQMQLDASRYVQALQLYRTMEPIILREMFQMKTEAAR